MAVTVRDVAKSVGVSVSTVSRALSAPEMVAPATRARVVQAAQNLGYQPNRAARGLITGRTGNIGLVIPDLENPYFASVTKGVQARARAAGYSVFVADSDEDAASERSLVASLTREVDGLILCSPRDTDEQIAPVAGDTTVVLVNRKVRDLPAITVDNGDGIAQAVRHLRALGHRRIAWAGGPASSWSNDRRVEGLQAIELELTDIEIVNLGNYRPFFSGGVAAADLALASGATAVVSYNDLMAIGLIDRLRNRGVDVPGQISVVGFDNVSVATLVSPMLTTVALPLGLLGRAAVDLLLGLVDESGHASPTSTQLPVELVIRQSTAEAPQN